MFVVLGLFNIKFPNNACSGTDGSSNGVCVTSSECSAEGGRSIGACAKGFGVCCQSNTFIHSTMFYYIQ